MGLGFSLLLFHNKPQKLMSLSRLVNEVGLLTVGNLRSPALRWYRKGSLVLQDKVLYQIVSDFEILWQKLSLKGQFSSTFLFLP